MFLVVGERVLLLGLRGNPHGHQPFCDLFSFIRRGRLASTC